MEKLNENDLFVSFKPKTERTLLGQLLNKQKNRNRNKKFLSNRINLIKNPFINFQNQKPNNIKFPKLITKYPKSFKSNLNLNFPKINSSQIVEEENISCLEKIPYRHLKELSVNIFQSNDIDLVRNLNPDSNIDLVGNILFKEQLKNNSFNLSNYFKKDNKENNGDSKEKFNKNEGDGEENKDFQKKISEVQQSGFIEKELNKKLKKLREDYIIKKEEKIKINNKFKEKLNEIDSIEYDIQFIDNEQQILTNNNTKLSEDSPKSGEINGKNQKNNNQNSKNKKEKENQPQENGENTEDKMSQYVNYFKSQKKRETEKIKKQKKIFELKQDINQLKAPFNSICQEINELKNTERNTKQKLMRHYLELLYNGKEIRNDGLIWIIKAIWKMGENVPLSFMPTFLDLDAIKYLFNMTKISIEIDSTKKYIYDIMRKLKEKVNSLPKNKLMSIKDQFKEESKNKFNNNDKVGFKDFDEFNTNENDTVKNNNNDVNNIKLNLLPSFEKNRKSSLRNGNKYIFKKKLIKSLSTPDIMKRLSIMSQSSILNMSHLAKKEEVIGTILQFSKKFEQKEKNQLDITSLPEVLEIKKLRKKIALLNQQKKEMKRNEINRIFNEYANNDYEKIYHAPIDVVLGALLGEHSRNLEVSNFNIFKKGFLEEVKNLRFYEYVKRK